MLPLNSLVLISFVSLVLVSSCTKTEENIAGLASQQDYSVGASSTTNPGFAVQYPSGTDMFRVAHSGLVNVTHDMLVGGNATIGILHIDTLNSTDVRLWIP